MPSTPYGAFADARWDSKATNVSAPCNRRLDDAMAHVEGVFAGTRIADLTHGSDIQPLCAIAEVAHA